MSKTAHVRIVDEELVDETDVALLGRQTGDVLAVHDDLPRSNPIEAGHQLDQGCLSGAGFAEQHVEVTGLEAKAGFLDVEVTADALGNVSQFEGHAQFLSAAIVYVR